ncbi:MAG: DNA polymerase III subunit beta [Acidimicrobiia bacterium]|nr:DNA polymerase III subunit beta [Acidimicrobiia bacterium]
MKIRSERDDLADALGRAFRAIGTRSAIPVLQGLLCETNGNKLQITGTDLEVTVQTGIEVEIADAGRAVIPGRLLTDAVRRMPPGHVVVDASENEVVISGRGPEFRLRPLEASDFPAISTEEGTGVVVDGEVLADAIGQVVIAASTDAARPILTAVLFETSDNGLRLVSTDAYRLAVRDLVGVGLEGSGLVPARGLRELARTVGAAEVTTAVLDREVVFSSERGSLRLRLIDGNFPNYASLLPDSFPAEVLVNREEMLDTLNRVFLVAEDHIPVRFEVSDSGVDVTVSRQDVGGETEHLEGKFKGEEPISVAFNPRYLADGVNAITSEQIRIKLVDGVKPAVVDDPEDPNYLYLLMPVRV